jgi:undecaprenyl-diphosphatase
MAINSIDYNISAFFNGCCRKSELFDRTVSFISDNHLLKGGVLALVIWFVWYMRGVQRDERRQIIICGLAGTFLSMFLARILPHVLEFRQRPLLNPANHFVEPYGLNRTAFDALSSFPSDHCALFFGLATCIFLASRRWGVFAFVYVLLIIVFPRLYLGLHYATDIISGGILGAAVVYIMTRRFFREKAGAPLLSYEAAYPGVFYSFFFLVTFAIGEMFTSMRTMATFVMHPHGQVHL